MGHTRAADASLRVHARGLARSISRPAYDRLLATEPFLRRAVPVLIVIFLVAVALGAAVQIIDDRRQALSDSEHELALFALSASEALARRLGEETDPVKVRAALSEILPPRALRFERRFLVTDAGGRVIAAEPSDAMPRNEQLADTLGSSSALALFAGKGDPFQLLLSDGTESLAALRDLDGPLGQIAAFQPKAAALARWTADSAVTVTLVTTTGSCS
jgi:two-component system cell cycle sensor histidine kinase PleC